MPSSDPAGPQGQGPTETKEGRLADLMLLAASHLQSDPTYGATKLNKSLFFSDHLHYKRHGSSISGATYERLPRAPAPRDVLAAREDLIDQGAAVLETRGYLGHVQQRLIPLVEPDTGSFLGTELTLVAEVCEAVRGHSHANVLGWQLSGEREEIPYVAAFLSTATPRRAELEHAGELAADLGLSGTPHVSGRPRPGGTAPTRRTVASEWPLDDLRGTYPRAEEVLAGIEWALARWPDGFHRIPGTRLHLLKTEWPIPALATWFTLDGETRATVRAVEESLPYVVEEDGTD